MLAMASSISCVLLKPTVAQSMPALRKAKFMAATRSSWRVKVPSPTSFMLMTPMPCFFTGLTCSTTSETSPGSSVSGTAPSMRVPLWFMRIMAICSQSNLGTWRSAGNPCTEAPRLRMIFFSCASSTPSCQRLVSSTQLAVCCQWSSMMSKYSVCEVLRISSKRFIGSSGWNVVTLVMS